MPTKPPKNPVSAADRAAFVHHVEEWQTRLGLGDWRINVSEKPHHVHAAVVDRCIYDARLASIKLGSDLGGTKVTDPNLEALAVHELAHVWLHELRVLCADPNTPGDVIDSAEHRIINTLVRLFVPASDL